MAGWSQVVNQSLYYVTDTQTLIGHETVGMLAKHFFDNVYKLSSRQVVCYARVTSTQRVGC